MADEKPTVEMPRPPDWAIRLTESVVSLRVDVKDRFDAIDDRLARLEGSDKTLAEEVGRMVLDVRDLRAADRRHEDDLRRLSERTRDTSNTASSADLAHESQLAQERAAREALAAKVDAITESQGTQLVILGRLDNIAKNPMVKTMAAMLMTALITWLAGKGVSLK